MSKARHASRDILCPEGRTEGERCAEGMSQRVRVCITLRRIAAELLLQLRQRQAATVPFDRAINTSFAGLDYASPADN